MATKKKLLQAAAGSAGGEPGLDVDQVFNITPKTYSGSDLRGIVIENGLNLGQTYGSGSVSMNLDMTLSSASTTEDDDYVSISSNNILNFGTGDFTVEFWAWIKSYPSSQGFADLIGGVYNEFGLGVYNDVLYYGNVEVSNVLSYSYSNYFDKWTHIALSRSNGATNLYLDGTEVVNASDGLNWSSSGGMSFGKYGTRTHGVQGYMSNVRVVKGTGLYTSNFTPSTSDLTAVSGTALLTAQGSDPLVDNSGNNHTITTNGDAKASVFGPFDAADAGEGGLVWEKNRTTTSAHLLYDTERGVRKSLSSNSTAGEVNTTTYGVSAFTSNGFVFDEYGGSTKSIFWSFRKAPKFFDVVKWVGDGNTTKTLSHNLGSVPGCIIVKRIDSGSNWLWPVYHRGLNDGVNPENYNLRFNSYVGQNTDNGESWGNTAPTSTEFTVGNGGTVNASGGNYVAYLFAHNDGDGDFGPNGNQDIIKCGYFNGTDNIHADIDLGFEPQWIMVKRADTDPSFVQYQSWIIQDTMRGLNVRSYINSNAYEHLLHANYNIAEGFRGDGATTATSSQQFLLRSDGFSAPPTGVVEFNRANSSYIYVAIRKGPLNIPTEATDVFNVTLGDSFSEPHYNSNFAVDMAMQRYRVSAGGTNVYSRIISGGENLNTATTAARTSDSSGEFDYVNGFYNSSRSSDFVAWLWKRAPGYFDTVGYAGNGSTYQNITHNLDVVPEMMWIKRRDDIGSWRVYHKELGATKYLNLDAPDTPYTSTVIFNDTAPTNTQFTVGSAGTVNASGGEYIAHLFASVDGISKVGSYVGNGNVDTDTQDIDCGFTNGARLVIIKDTTVQNNWVILDTARGIVAGGDPRLFLDDTPQESSYDYVDPYSAGFTVVNTFDNFNSNGNTYIFYAIA